MSDWEEVQDSSVISWSNGKFLFAGASAKGLLKGAI